MAPHRSPPSAALRRGRTRNGRTAVDRLAIVDAYVAAESDKAKRAILKHHRASVANVSSWATTLYGKSLRRLYASAQSVTPPPRVQTAKEKAMTKAQLRAEIDRLQRLVTLAWRRGAFDDILLSLSGQQPGGAPAESEAVGTKRRAKSPRHVRLTH
jgi:hypothetical protein